MWVADLPLATFLSGIRFPWVQRNTRQSLTDGRSAFGGRGMTILRRWMNYGHVPDRFRPPRLRFGVCNDVDTAAWNRSEQRVVTSFTSTLSSRLSLLSTTTGAASAFDPKSIRRTAASGSTIPRYLVQQALPSYAELFVSYRPSRRRVPSTVSAWRTTRCEQNPPPCSRVLSHLNLPLAVGLDRRVATLSRRGASWRSRRVRATPDQFHVSRRTVARPCRDGRRRSRMQGGTEHRDLTGFDGRRTGRTSER